MVVICIDLPLKWYLPNWFFFLDILYIYIQLILIIGSSSISPTSRTRAASWLLEGTWLTGASAKPTAADNTGVLTPVFADHDRSSHAERWALLAVLRMLDKRVIER